MNILTIGGGTGNSFVLAALKNHGCNLSTIVNTMDNGGSSGRLRKELNVLPPGDIRQCLVALSDQKNGLKKIMNYRFPKNDLKGHSFGNLLIASLEKSYGSIEEAIKIISRSLGVKNAVIPVTLNKTNLCAKIKNKVVRGEHKIYNTEISKLKNIKFHLKPKAKINPRAKTAIKNADFIIISPGNLYCSLVPIFLTNCIDKAIRKTKAKIIYISPLANLKQHTEAFYLEDYVNTIQKYLNRPLDYIIWNKNIDFVGKNVKNSQAVLIKNIKNFQNTRIINKDLVNKNLRKKDKNDFLERTSVSHDPKKIWKAIEEIINNE